MKLSKKILSIILAVALVLGTVAVAANAETALTQFEGSVQTYTFEVEGAENGVLTVKPGDTFNLKVYMETNYYVGSAGCELIIWTNNFFNTVSANDLTSSSFVTGWYLPTVTSPAQAAMIPTAYKTTHTGIYVGRAMNGGQTQAKALTTPELIYTIKFVVPETAVAGTTATILMPEGAIYTATNTRLGKIRQNISDNATTYGSTYASAYAQTVNVPSLTVKVASAVEYCDYAALETAVAKAPAMAADYYDAVAYKAWTDAKAAGQALLDAEALEKTDENQKTINDAAALIESTFAALVAQYVDLESLENAVANNKTPAYAAEYYDATAYKAWQDAYAAAEAALATYAGAPITKQGEVNDITNALVDAWTALVPAFANLDKLNAAVEAYDELAYGKDYYDADLYAAWEAALADAKAAQTTYANAPATKQAEVDAIADDLAAAYAKLVPSTINLTKLNDAVSACAAPAYAAEYYNTADYAAYTAALADAKSAQAELAGAPATKQGEADAAADALTAAFAKLVPAFANLDKLNAAVVDCATPEYAEEYYELAAFEAYEKALAGAKAAQTTYANAPATKQAEIDAVADDLTAAYAALTPIFADLDALNAAVVDCATPEYAEEYYDEAEYAAWEAALADAKAAQATYVNAPATKQTEIDVIVAALTNAYEALDPEFVSLDKLNAAIEASDETEYAAEYYDEAAYAAWAAALETATQAQTAYAAAPATKQAEVDAIADDLTVAYAALAPQFVSYEKLEKAIADYGEAPEADFYYTPETWAAYQEALTAAVDANENRPEPLPAANDNNQAAVDALADALADAFNKLEAAECHVISVTPLQESYSIGDVINLEVLVEGTASKIQLIREDGVTFTCERTAEAIKSITDNGDGTETWIVARRIYKNSSTEYAKARMGKIWDTGVVPYDLECSKPDYAVRSVEITVNGEAATTASNKDILVVTIVTGPAATKVRFIDPVTGNTMTLSNPTAINDDGTKIWIHARQYGINEYAFDIQSKASDGVWYESDFAAEFTITKKTVPQVPSTGDVKDAVLDATVAKKRVVRDKTQQIFTIETDIAAKAVRIIAKDGTVIKVTEATSVAEDKATWTIEKTYSIIGDYSYTVEALYGSTWIANEAITLDFTVVY